MKNVIIFSIVFFFSGSTFCFAASSHERASELKVWREQCNDPDYDLRLAYVEEALETGDMSIQRICIRAALESDNADIRNLGLRAVIASTKKIFFDVKQPPELVEMIKDAGNNEKKMKVAASQHVARGYEWIKSGIIFLIEDSSIYDGDSEWYPIARNIEPKDKAQANIIGGRVKWTGTVLLLKNVTCDLNVQLVVGGRLEGTLQCENWYPFPVSANLF